MNRDGVMALLAQIVREAGTKVEAARRLEVSHSFLVQVLDGRREPGPKLLAALGLQKVVSYRKIGEG